VSAAVAPPTEPEFYAREVHEVARDLIGCVLRHGAAAGRIVEAESYHQSEPASHAYGGLTQRNRHLFAAPGTAYVYRSYGIHACLNAVAEEDGVGAAVLIRALEPVEGIAQMRARRKLVRLEELCSGPGKLTQALGIGLKLDGTSLYTGPIEVLPPAGEWPRPTVVRGGRIGITKAADLPWRFCDAGSRHVSRPWPAAMRRRPRRVAA
jgi:DNA-3-methyladenine glycosylase